MSLDYITMACRSLRAKYPHLREGQAWFMAVEEYRNEWALELRKSKFDPFYKDEHLIECIVWLEGKSEEERKHEERIVERIKEMNEVCLNP